MRSKRGIILSFEEQFLPIQEEIDIVKARKKARELAEQQGFGLTDITRIVTAASELARNIFHYAKIGKMRWKILKRDNKTGLELIFEDNGPGIPDIEKAMEEGYSTGGGLGMGLPGTKRLMDQFLIESTVGKGTTVIIRKWR